MESKRATTYDLSGKRVWVAGHRGLAGSAIVHRLAKENCTILTVDRAALDLRSGPAVESFIADEKPQAIVVAAAKVGGILVNNGYPADFLYENLMIELSVIHAAFRLGVEKLLFLGSSCIYPRDAPQPIPEEALLTGPLEPTNEAYALAKIAGIKLCQFYRQQYGCDFISAMPANLYGPNDNFHPDHAHVPAALLTRFHKAKREGDRKVKVWGTGKPQREFLFVDDLADACVFLMKNYSDRLPINIGSEEEVSIRSFAEIVRAVVGFEGRLVFDPSFPDGIPRKKLDTRRLTALGWQAETPISDGLIKTYRWYLDHLERLRKV